ncbi:hypothetical protein DKP76_07770 [Falsochrobactrum shanghaiense]|uniref:Uncharacterized protein n=1 Tax=Falsochrobactrum shanghaiense TaxID=2201899 RepID=A0A316J900_9HYPH|nr:hypothetical protein DKP76_07770 [Falsochrobactrum shanghaiense]
MRNDEWGEFDAPLVPIPERSETLRKASLAEEEESLKALDTNMPNRETGANLEINLDFRLPP